MDSVKIGWKRLNPELVRIDGCNRTRHEARTAVVPGERYMTLTVQLVSAKRCRALQLMSSKRCMSVVLESIFRMSENGSINH